jgi:tripartite-type tricarboxylate transporter receptor subunit TctC
MDLYFPENLTKEFIMKITQLICSCAFLCSFISPAFAATFPDHPIRLIVPFTAGGNVDISARTIAQGLTEQLGQSIIVENKPGANTMIATEFVAKAPGDGYTLLLAGAEGLAINPHVYKKVNYDALKDFSAVGLVGSFPFALVINPKLAVNNLSEFIEYAKSRSGKLNYSSWGIGSTSQIAFEKLKQTSGLDLVHVPFQGAAPAITAVASGDVDAMMVPLSVALPQASNGRIKILGVSSEKRIASADSIPTLTEQGVPVVISGWQILVAPKNTPAAVVQTLNQNLNKVLKGEVTRTALVKIGITPSPGTPAQANSLIESEWSRWGKVATEAKINLD